MPSDEESDEEYWKRWRVGTWIALGVFVVTHIGLVFLDDTSLLAYAKWAEVLTHLFAVPAIARGGHTREQIVVATAVSVVYHSVRNFSNADYDGLRRLDHATSTALISTVFLKYFLHMHVVGVIVLFAGMAAAFPFGNVLSSAVTAAILVLIVALPVVDAAARAVLSGIVHVLSLGGSAPPVKDLDYATPLRWRLAQALALQILSVVAYFVGDSIKRIDKWSHCLWHAFAYTCLFILVDVIADHEKPTRDKSLLRPSRRNFNKIENDLGRKRVPFRFT